MRPKKALQTLLIGCLILLTQPNLCEARVSGVCSNCHTMHNSQQGSAVDSDGPHLSLLNTSCLGCHSSSTSDTIDGSGTPIVYNSGSGGPTKPLAGGNFYYVTTAGGGDRMGHNVLGTEDATLHKIPPGAVNNDPLPGIMSCAGTTGCHGDKTIAGSGETPDGSDTLAISGAHHSTGSIDGSTIGKSYRFLDGITGTEDDKWEQNPSSTVHNIYKGAARTDDDTATAGTISSLCAYCHTYFHNGNEEGTSPVDGTIWGTPWVRHPTDFDMSTALNNPAINYPSTYNTEVPIAYDGTKEIIMCLSCHRAHGSPNESILRWDYRAWPGDTSGTNGCGVCHTDKD